MVIDNKELSRLQKNARNKLYRLRKKGVTNAQINMAAVPIKDWNTVQRMNTREKRAYMKELREFNSRDNRIELQGEGNNYILQRGQGVALPYEQVFSYRIAEAERNIQRAERRGMLQKIADNIAENASDKALDDLEKVTINRPSYISQDDIGRSGIEFFTAFVEPRRNPFKNIDQLKAATHAYERAVANNPKSEEAIRNRNDGYISSVKTRMAEEGVLTGSLENMLDGLTDNQIAYLYYMTDFDSLASVMRYSRDYEQGYSSVTDDTKSNAAANIQNIVSAVVRAVK